MDYLLTVAYSMESINLNTSISGNINDDSYGWLCSGLLVAP